MRSIPAISFVAAIFAFSLAGAMDIGPYEFTFEADVRWVHVDSPLDSFAEGGLGLSRFDESHDGVRLGRILAHLNGPLTETLRFDVALSGTGDVDANVLDVTEAFIEWRPYPRNRARFRSRIGAFYPSVSLENRSVGWQSPYSISSSAINTWIAEEIRAIGVEQSVTFKITDRIEGSANLGLYRRNDPMGVLLFQRGWAIHDRQTALFDSLPRPFPRAPHEATISFFREIDDRLGYYVGTDLKLDQHFVIKAMRYDNRGDPAIRGYKDSAWLSRFNALGVRYEFPSDTTMIGQWMDGDTSVGPSDDGRGMLILYYRSYFALASQRVGEHRFTARYDRMETESVRGASIFDGNQNAAAWTFAYLWNFAHGFELAAELVDLRGSLGQRGRRGLDPYAREQTWQLALRYFL